MRRQSALSRAFFEAEVTATGPDGTEIPPASLPVELAFVGVGAEPDEDDWQPGVHLRDDVFGVLVGPGALALAKADYDVWQRITDDPEQPVGPFGKFRIF